MCVLRSLIYSHPIQSPVKKKDPALTLPGLFYHISFSESSLNSSTFSPSTVIHESE